MLLSKNSENRLAVYYFNDAAEQVSSFSQSVSDLQSALDGLSYNKIKAQATNHPAGFQFVAETFEIDGRPSLSGSEKIHLLITDGVPYKACKHITGAEVNALPLPAACESVEEKKNDDCKCAISVANQNRQYT